MKNIVIGLSFLSLFSSAQAMNELSQQPFPQENLPLNATQPLQNVAPQVPNELLDAIKKDSPQLILEELEKLQNTNTRSLIKESHGEIIAIPDLSIESWNNDNIEVSLHIATQFDSRKAVEMFFGILMFRDIVIDIDNLLETLIRTAAKYNSKNTLEFFISKINDINAKDNYGKTPLHYANGKDTIEVLLSKGAI